MKTSFYFFLWFILYVLIAVSGKQYMIENAFFVALIAVLLISRLDKYLLADELTYRDNLHSFRLFEILYNDDKAELLKILKQSCIWMFVWAVYCVLTIMSLAIMGESDIIAYVVFAFFGFYSIYGSFRSFVQYRKISEDGLEDFDFADYSLDEETYNEYRQLRATYPAQALAPEAPTISKWVNTLSILFAVPCILIGALNLYLVYLNGTISIISSTELIWAVLAFYWGIRDIFSSVNILRGKPVPLLK